MLVRILSTYQVWYSYCCGCPRVVLLCFGFPVSFRLALGRSLFIYIVFSFVCQISGEGRTHLFISFAVFFFFLFCLFRSFRHCIVVYPAYFIHNVVSRCRGFVTTELVHISLPVSIYFEVEGIIGTDTGCARCRRVERTV